MAPILVKEYTWNQNDYEVHIRLPLRHVKQSQVNIITTEKFLKVNFAVYLFQIVLTDKVDPTKTKFIIKENEVIVELTKSIPKIWDSLNQTVKKNDYIKLKEKLILQEHEKAARESEIKLKEKQERQKIINTYQINLNKDEVNKIQIIKDQAKMKGFQKISELQHSHNLTEKTYPFESQNQAHKNELILPIPVPLPRNSGVIQFDLSHRILPTPKRISTRSEEEEWLKKEAEAMRDNGFIPDDLTEDERNPSWLLSKGMSFLKNENYLAAINAFSYGCRIAPKMPIFHLRLGQTQLKLHHYCKTIDNCTKALELLIPVVEKNKSLRIEAYRTRAAAYECINESELSSADYHSSEILS